LNFISLGCFILSKSRLLSFRQCPLKLWNEIHRRDLAKPPDASQQLIFDQGTRIGQLAQKRYPGGMLIEAEYWDTKNALRQTFDALNRPTTTAIIEAAFFADNTLVRADILKRFSPNEWEMWEVKSVGSPKEIHVIDVAIQTEVARRWAKSIGHPFQLLRSGVLHLNKDYLYQGGDYELDKLFTEFDCTNLLEDYREEVDALIRDGLATAALKDPPESSPGKQCNDPYACPFSGTACEEPPKEELKLLPRMTAKKIETLKSRGIFRIDQLSEDDYSLSEPQRRAIAAWKSGEPIIEPGLKDLLTKIGFPRMHLDFETIMPALPIFPGTSPFGTIPFQYSIHIELQKGQEAVHTGYLHNDATDPRRPLAEAMLETLEAPASDLLRANCPILTYSAYEKRIIGELAEALPNLRLRLLALRARLLDLLPIVRNHVYLREFGGGFSIKKVLPALIPGMGYSDLDITEGGTASLKFIEMINLRKSGGDSEAAQKIYNDLWLYCQRDTEAMVLLLRKLEANI